MFILTETRGYGGCYHECAASNECRSADSRLGNSNSPGFFSERQFRRCPRCGGRLNIYPCPASNEYRIIRTGDGLVVDRFPKTDLEKAESRLRTLQRR